MSIILAAMAPVMTTRNKSESLSPWRYTDDGSNAYYGIASSQVAMIGQRDLSEDGSDDAARLILNSSDTNPIHLSFKRGTATLGRLYMNDSNIVLGNTDMNLGSNTGANNIAIGMSNILSHNTSGGSNIGIGDGALANNTSGTSNTALGTSLGSNTTGNDNTALGDDSMVSNSTGSSNVAVGVDSLANSNGSWNVAVGANSYHSGLGGSNTIVGGNAMSSKDGTNNVALGTQALQQGGGDGNIAIGANANNVDMEGLKNTISVGFNSRATGESSISIGSPLTGGAESNTAAQAKDIGSVAIGAGAVAGNGTNGNYGVAIGYASSANGNLSTAIGSRTKAVSVSTALGESAQATESGSTALGFGAEASGMSSLAVGMGATASEDSSIVIGTGEASGQGSVAIGTGAIASGFYSLAIGGLGVYYEGGWLPTDTYSTEASGSESVALGSGSLATGANSTALGSYAIAKGANNIAIGKNACQNVTGSNKICIGANSGPSSSSSWATDSVERIFIGSKSKFNNGPAVLEVHNTGKTVYAHDGSEYKASDSTVVVNGNLIVKGIISSFIVDRYGNNVSGYRTLERFGEDENNASLRYSIESGKGFDEYFTNGGRGFSSDRRLKYVGKEFTSGLDKIRDLKVFNYTFKKDEKKTPHVSVIAQDLQKVFPDAVKKGADGFLTIRFEDMFFAMINAIKELDAKYQAQEKRINDLEKRIEKLESQIK